MRPGDTEIGGANRGFRTTIWSDILAAGDPSNPRSKEHVDQLIRSYWKPIYASIRTAWNTSAEDAKDYTQTFFARLIEKETCLNLQKDRGSFRSYLKAALKYFMINARESESLRKPIHEAYSLDFVPAEMERLAPVAGADPEGVLDKEWFRCVMDASVEALRKSLNAEGKPKYFEVFKAYCLDSRDASLLGEPAGVSYQEIAAQLGLHHSDVRNYLSYCRKAIRTIVRDQVRDYAASDEEADREMKEAFGL